MAGAGRTVRGGTLRLRARLWVELNGQPALGDGKVGCLRLVDERGSIAAAAAAMGMSYRGLWGRIAEMERRLGVKLVLRQAGGRGGGRSRLTAQGLLLLGAYAQCRRRVDAAVERAGEMLRRRLAGALRRR